MPVASRTPEGEPSRCPICGHACTVEFSSFPTRDATCPCCGSLIMASTPSFEWQGTVTHAHTNRLHAVKGKATYTTFEEPLVGGDFMWLVLGAISVMLVAWNDGLVPTTGWWLMGVFVFGQFVFPWLENRARYGFLRTENLYLGAMMGWAIVAGPMTAAVMGPLLPYTLGLDFPSYVGGLLAILFIPPFAAIQGVVIVGIVDLVVWLWSGKSLHSRV